MARFIGFLLLVGFIGAYFWQLLALVAVVALAYYGRQWWNTEQARVAKQQAEHRAIAARADEQHSWVLAGDPRGTYGRYMPATI